MPQLTVELGSRRCPIVIESGLLADSEALRRCLDKHCPTEAMTVVISNEIVWKLFGASVSAAIEGRPSHIIEISEGEEAKSIRSFYEVIGQMLESGCTRDSRVLALGGGVVGDLAGFVAASYMRGIDLVQIPTTLLAQVDSSVGGKTAVNHELAKNSIGAFKQPKAVIIDPGCLASLDARQIRAGIAEIIKYAVIGDTGFFQWLEERIDDLAALETAALERAIEVSCASKARVVAADELDSTGARALLNLGHSFGHALEQIGNYRELLHGEAVGCGMVMAARLSRKRGDLEEADCQRIVNLIERAGLPIRCPPGATAENMLAAMRLDKKNLGSGFRLILLNGIGQACLAPVAADELKAFLGEFVENP